MLASPETSLQVRALRRWALACEPTPEELEGHVRPLLDHAPPLVRLLAAAILAPRAGLDERTEALLRAAWTSDDPLHVSLAVEGCQAFGPTEEVLELCEQLLRHEDPGVRVSTLSLLGSFGKDALGLRSRIKARKRDKDAFVAMTAGIVLDALDALR